MIVINNLPAMLKIFKMLLSSQGIESVFIKKIKRKNNKAQSNKINLFKVNLYKKYRIFIPVIRIKNLDITFKKNDQFSKTDKLWIEIHPTIEMNKIFKVFSFLKCIKISIIKAIEKRAMEKLKYLKTISNFMVVK
jgi:hypothetical protein